MLQIRLLGQFDLRRNGERLGIRSRSGQSLFAYLVLNRGIAHRREMLAGLLWPDASESDSRSYLRKALWQVRKSLGTDPSNGQGYLVVDELSIAFDPAADYWLDAAAVVAWKRANGSSEDLIEAVSAYQGDLLPGFYDEWVVLERERLRAAFEQAMDALLTVLTDTGQWAEVIELSERWIALGTVPEPAFRALMIAHAALGNMARVGATYERCARMLQEELGVEPSSQTLVLYGQLRSSGPFLNLAGAEEAVRLASSAGPGGFPREITLDGPRTNLPGQLTSFVGRTREIEEISGLLSASRLITLTGAGGSGKSRLAIQVAIDELSSFGDGAWWVELAAITDPAFIPQAVAKALGLREFPGQSLFDSIARALRSRHLLLILDGCEHLLNAVPQLVENLLHHSPNLKIMATSRERLGIAGERVFMVPPLSTPDPHSVPSTDFQRFDAVRLFVERAVAVKGDYALTEENALAIAQVCHAVDGIPLAIELAAARVRALTDDQIADRLSDRFQLLTGGSRTALMRHQTLRATIDWSYQLLSEAECALLQRLAVFAAGWTVTAAETVCADNALRPDDVLDVLTRLADKSLAFTERIDGSEIRYRMLDTIREYASEKLEESGDRPRFRDQHLHFFVAFAEEAESQLFTAAQSQWINRLDSERQNFAAAIGWAIECEDGNSALRLVAALSWYWLIRGQYHEVRHLSPRIFSSPFARERNAVRARALSMTGAVQWGIDGQNDAVPLLTEALEIASEIGDSLYIAWSQVFLGIVYSGQGDYQKGQELLEAGLATCRALGSTGQLLVGISLAFLGDGAFYRGEYQSALDLYQSSVRVLREHGDLNFLAYPLRRSGHTARVCGNGAGAVELCQESLALNLELRHRQGTAACISALGCMTLALGKAHDAARLFGAAESELERIGASLLPADALEHERGVAAAHAVLGQKAFGEAVDQGRHLPIEAAIALAQAVGA